MQFEPGDMAEIVRPLALRNTDAASPAPASGGGLMVTSKSCAQEFRRFLGLPGNFVHTSALLKGCSDLKSEGTGTGVVVNASRVWYVANVQLANVVRQLAPARFHVRPVYQSHPSSMPFLPILR